MWSEELGVKGHFVPIINGKLEMASGKFRNCVGDYKASRSFSSLSALADREGDRSLIY